MAAGQQLLLQLVLWPLCRDLAKDRNRAILLAASLFGLAHLPSPWLAAMSFSAAVGWIFLYDRHRGVIPLVISQLLLSLLVHVAFPDRIHLGMRIGASALD
jgi:membrane protease YdiL (CAAX protease family)